MVVRRVEALGKFLDTDDGKNLLAGTKRASNILAHRGEEGQAQLRWRADAALYKLDEEKALAKAIAQVKSEAGAAVAKEDFAAAMSAMAKLRPAVDAFFDKVKVNDDDAKVRENRLKLLNEIRARRARSRIFPRSRIESDSSCRGDPASSPETWIPGQRGGRIPECQCKTKNPARWGNAGRGFHVRSHLRVSSCCAAPGHFVQVLAR